MPDVPGRRPRQSGESRHPGSAGREAPPVVYYSGKASFVEGCALAVLWKAAHQPERLSMPYAYTCQDC